MSDYRYINMYMPVDVEYMEEQKATIQRFLDDRINEGRCSTQDNAQVTEVIRMLDDILTLAKDKGG